MLISPKTTRWRFHQICIGFNPLFSLQDISAAVRKIEPEKSTKTREAETFLKSTPKCASAPQLYSKVDEANKKYDKVDLLLKCADEKYV